MREKKLYLRLTRATVFVLLIGCGNEDTMRSARGLQIRGVVEGFYGPLYSAHQRLDLLRFLAEAGLNYYVYAPKLDPFHRERWRDPYPTQSLQHFRDLTDLGRAIGVTVNFALSPGLSFTPNNADSRLVQEKLRSLFEVGVREFCLLFDDIVADSLAVDPDVQTALVNETYEFLQDLDPTTTLCFISNYYNGTTAELQQDTSPFRILFPIPSSRYYAAYRNIAPQVAIMWSGPRVFTDRLTVAEAARFRDFVGRPVVVWDNYPVNDLLLANELFLGPYQGREAGLEAALDGILVNPMLQPEATKIPLWTVGRFFLEMEDYDPHRAWEEAVQLVSGSSDPAALRLLAEQFQSHPLLGENRESPELAHAVEEFLAQPGRESLDTLAALFHAFSQNFVMLEKTLNNRNLWEELREPSRKLSLFGEAGLLALNLLRQKENGVSGEDLAPGIQLLEDKLAMAAAIPWRVGEDFGPELLRITAEREPKNTNVFQTFFDPVLEELKGR